MWRLRLRSPGTHIRPARRCVIEKSGSVCDMLLKYTHLELSVDWSRWKLSVSEKVPNRPLGSPTKISLKLFRSFAPYYRFHQLDSDFNASCQIGFVLFPNQCSHSNNVEVSQGPYR